MGLDREKFKALVYYICWRCKDDPSRLGAVKLNKALWIADFIAYERLGQPITGARYLKRQFGPVPSPILPLLKELEDAGKLRVTDTSYHGMRKKEYFPLAGEPGAFLSESEASIVEDVIRLVCDGHTATSISEASHNHIWQAAEDGEEIPYCTVFVEPVKPDEADIAWALNQLAAAIAC